MNRDNLVSLDGAMFSAMRAELAYRERLSSDGPAVPPWRSRKCRTKYSPPDISSSPRTAGRWCSAVRNDSSSAASAE